MLIWQPAVNARDLIYVAVEPHVDSTGDSGAGESRENIFERLKTLNLLSEGLVEKAGSGSSPANEFRVEARLYRELLRQLMLENRAASPAGKVPETLLLEMVRMSALLHAAADCKTGKYITCPPDLMVQLKSQQAALSGLFMDKLP